MSWLVALGHFLSVFDAFLAQWRTRLSQKRAEAEIKGRSAQATLDKIIEAKNARQDEQHRLRIDASRLRADDGYKRG